jgi:hypothetical protein
MSSSHPPKYSENFRVETTQLNDLYQELVKEGLFTRTWSLNAHQPTGDNYQRLVVGARGKRITIEDYLINEQQVPAEAMYAAVQALVPKDAGQRLETRRNQYMLEHGGLPLEPPFKSFLRGYHVQ